VGGLDIRHKIVAGPEGGGTEGGKTRIEIGGCEKGNRIIRGPSRRAFS